MTWDAFHTRGEVLRDVVDAANTRRDGTLPFDLPGATTAFPDDFSLVTALHLRWHTRLAGHVERALDAKPADLESAVLSAWRRTAAELAGVRDILDAYAAHPTSEAMRAALATAQRKDWVLMAVMAGLASGADPVAARTGRRIEQDARDSAEPAPRASNDEHHAVSLLERLKAHLVA